MEKLKLSKQVMINGKEYKELPYDFDELTAQDKLNASKKYKKDGNAMSVQEIDSGYHLYLFAEAVSKADPDIDITDIMRIRAKDSAKIEGLVRDFFFLDSEDISQTDTSEEQ